MTMTSLGGLDDTLRVEGHRVRVRVRGSGRPLLLLNGIGAPLELWRPLTDRLDGVCSIAFDAPGSGRSRTPDVPLSIGGHAVLALGVLEELGCQRASVLGFSFGGLVAQEVARRAGPRLDRLVLAATSCGWGGLPGNLAALLQVVLPEVMADEQLPPGAGRPPDRLGSLYQVWAAASWSSVPWLGGVRRPTLVLTGDQDRVVPPGNARILSALLPDARVHTVPGGDHLCLVDRAADVAPVLRDFLGA